MSKTALFCLAVFVTGMMLLFGGCAPEEAPEEEPEVPDEEVDEETLVIGIPGDIETVDPGFGAHTRTNETLKNIYDQFFHYAIEDTGEGYYEGDTTEVVGDAIESYEFSDDFMEVTLQVREGMEFVETGNPVTAEDIHYKFERAFGLEASEAWVFNTAGVYDLDQVSIEDDYEVKITFEDPSPLFLPLLRDQCTGIYDSEQMKEHATEDDPWATEWLARNYAGSGPYYVESWDRGEEMVLAKNEDHWAADEEHPYFDKVILRVVEDSTTRMLMLEEGTIDIAAELNPEELFELEGAPGVDVLSVPSITQWVFGVNFEHEPFDDTNVRQALAYAIPYDEIVEGVFRGEASKAPGPISSQSPHFDEFDLEDFDMYDTDMEKAEKLLQESGYDPEELEFSIGIQDGIPVAEEIAILVRDGLQQIGVDVSIDIQPASVFAERMAEKDQEAFIRDNTPYVDDPWYFLYLHHETDTIINWTNFSNPRVDEIIEETSDMVTEVDDDEIGFDDDERREYVREAIEIAQEELAMYHLVEVNYMAATSDDIVGFVNEPDMLWRYNMLERVE